jgi:uncharacterized protein YgbK (DUF1537 family)
VQPTGPVKKADLLANLPDPWPEELLPRIQAAVKDSRRTLVVLDDDPTGTQTVHGIPVLTEWSEASLRAELQSGLPAFYILTNSRSLPLADAQKLNAEIGDHLRAAAEATGQRFAVVSRSDSTLRGHFPGELDALSGALGKAFDGWILCPFFQEGGRFTIADVHYVQAADRLIPAGETEFAQDAVFGYRSSRLPQWVEEKTSGRVRADDTLSIGIADIRRHGHRRVEEILLSVSDQRICVVNAGDYRDLEVFVLGLLSAEAMGKTFLYRTAASFVRVRAGISPRSLLSASDLKLDQASGGLIIVGSYVPQTTRQLEAMLHANPAMVQEPVSVGRLLDETERDAECRRVAARIDRALRNGHDAVVYTSRAYQAAADAASRLHAGKMISNGLISILRQVRARPRYLLAKGGITASDAATAGLNVKRAMVAGQIIAGVPVWQLGSESRHPQMPFIVFPGNVGGAGALLQVVELLHPG